MINESNVGAVLKTTPAAPGENDNETVISLHPTDEAAAACQVYVDNEHLVVVSVGRGLRWELEESAEEMIEKVKGIVGAVLAGDVEETTKFDRQGKVVSTKGHVIVNSRRIDSSVRDMTKNPFKTRQVVTYYTAYSPGSLELQG